MSETKDTHIGVSLRGTQTGPEGERTNATAPFNFGNFETLSIRFQNPRWLCQETKNILATTL